MKHNRFYSEFDTQTFTTADRPEARSPDGYRSAFQVDRDRLIHSYAFRRLQSKTQVFLSGEYDFYRTRLTHSMEVAQIGRSICHYLVSHECPTSKLLGDDFYIDGDLVEAVCLAHDLGHPPFGHSGERTLQELMRAHGGFEGNAQTLRLLAETIFETESKVSGMQPTRALVDGILKYKKLYREFPKIPKNHFLYNEQAVERDFVFAGAKIPKALHAAELLNKFKSVECQIMDWADDAAYSVNDIVDGTKAGFLTIERIEAWARKQGVLDDKASRRKDYLATLIKAIREDKLEQTFARRIGHFIHACTLRERTNFMSAKTNRYRFELVVNPEALEEASFYKRMANDIIFESPQLQQIEYKARRVLHGLWNAAWENYVGKGDRMIKILPPRVARLLAEKQSDASKARHICDWLAGMTDGMIVRTYRRLFDPEFGSIRDLS